jgi:hypothetical protein
MRIAPVPVSKRLIVTLGPPDEAVDAAGIDKSILVTLGIAIETLPEAEAAVGRRALPAIRGEVQSAKHTSMLMRLAVRDSPAGALLEESPGRISLIMCRSASQGSSATATPRGSVRGIH